MYEAKLMIFSTFDKNNTLLIGIQAAHSAHKHPSARPQMRGIPHSYAKAPKRGFRPSPNALFKAFRKGFVSCCESKVPKGGKYKPYILKYKALILK